MKLKIYAAALLVAACMASCSTSKSTLPYFMDLDTEKEGTLPLADYTPKIKPDDQIQINITSEYREAAEQYNVPFGNTYVVNKAGDINLPHLGTMHVVGMTLPELRDKIYAEVSKDIKDPVVDVRFSRFSVTVGGEVKEPQIVYFSGNRLSVLDALVAAGDITEYGERGNVLVIREENGERKYAHLDLNSSETLTSPYYYLQQNDYVYVSPNEIRQANSKYNQNNSYKLSVISTIVSASSVIASLIIALTVK